MFVAIGFMVLGVVIGFLINKNRSRSISKIITFLIWLLLFILGLEVGGNPLVLAGMTNIGIEAFIIAFGASFGSAIVALLLWSYVKKK